MGGCQLGRKVVTHDSKSDLPLAHEWKYESNIGKYLPPMCILYPAIEHLPSMITTYEH